jgi:hypothetical protein
MGMERGAASGSRRFGRRRARIGLIVLAACAGTSLLVAGPAAAKHKGKGPKKLSVSFKTKSQSDQALLSAGKVDVVVRSPKKQKVSLSVSGFTGGPALADAVRVKAKPGKRRSVSLPLNPTGREVLQGCGADNLVLTGTPVGKGKKKGKKSMKKK